MSEPGNYDIQEIHKYDQLAPFWWDLEGEMGTLHQINPLRLQFIRGSLEIQGKRVLDVGCGGGILSEAMARAGAVVTGIDLSRDSVTIAKQHAEQEGVSLEYRLASLEEVSAEAAESFDLVTCMEMLEHVPHPDRIIAECAHVLKPGGHAVISSINRTLKAFLFAIIGGEYILRLLPKGSHRYNQLIRPRELKYWARQNNLAFVRSASLMYNPFNGNFKVALDKTDVNYMVHFVKN